MEQHQLNNNNSSNMDHFEPDPLLQPGAFIDPNPPTTPPNGVAHQKPNGKSPSSSSTVDPAAASVDASKPSDEKVASSRPDWLPPDWEFDERVRTTGASAGSRDKYYLCPVTKRQFRSKKEVFRYIETGSTKKRKDADTDADSTPATESPAKRKKSEAKSKKISLKNFNFDDVPAKVKWMLTDIYEVTWRPLVNGVDRVPESAKQQWTAAFTYLTLQNGGGSTFL